MASCFRRYDICRSDLRVPAVKERSIERTLTEHSLRWLNEVESELSDMGSVDDWNARLVGTTEEMKLCWKTLEISGLLMLKL